MIEGVVGVILAGGLATRMGGGDKALLELRPGWCLLDEVLQRFSDQVATIALNINGDASRFSKFSLPTVEDRIEGRVGPLAGILAGMEWAHDHGGKYLLSVAADTPFFPRSLCVDLFRARGPKGLALAATREPDGKVWAQPTFGLWPVGLRRDLRDALTQRQTRKIVDWTNQHEAGHAVYDLTPARLDPFFNVNTPEDLVTAQAHAQRGAVGASA
jgi:molybdopterin-guanine dinucleotide biosynthesis protein A